uniref:Peptidase M28 domain-containing protein n=1 Tax=Hucho hucho TaxID=62062 RepID=A0A4W5L5F9_9TELE
NASPENPWLVQAYVHAAKHPFASVVGQEVFQSGVIPSDTDFRIYRDFGNIPGIDLAFIENGFLYHTKYDTSDRILTDSIQRAGKFYGPHSGAFSVMNRECGLCVWEEGRFSISNLR